MRKIDKFRLAVAYASVPTLGWWIGEFVYKCGMGALVALGIFSLFLPLVVCLIAPKHRVWLGLAVNTVVVSVLEFRIYSFSSRTNGLQSWYKDLPMVVPILIIAILISLTISVPLSRYGIEGNSSAGKPAG